MKILRISIKAFLLITVTAVFSCKSVAKIPKDLKFNSKRHSYIRTMPLHMLFIDSVNGKKLKYSSKSKIYEIETTPGMKTIDVIYAGGANAITQSRDVRLVRRFKYVQYKRQKKRIRFRALPGKIHYIQYIAYANKPMIVWQNSCDYISHLRDKPVYKKPMKKNNYTVTVSRIVKGNKAYVKKRFQNELILQEYLHNFIGKWSISLMFRPISNKITVNLSGIGEKEKDNEVIGYYKFVSMGRNRTKIIMYSKGTYHEQYPDFMRQVFTRFDIGYRKNTLK